jgi:parvulin-like peptidyl-prolyl cis-trans isomerase-like protein
MRTRWTKRLARRAPRALVVCAALTFLLAGCGAAAKSSSRGIAATVDALPVPSDGVIARVGPYAIGEQAFKNAYAEAVDAEPAATRAVAVPPDYASCVERLASIAKSLDLTLPSRALRAAKCRQRYEAMRDAVLSRAILGLWVAAEARALGLQVSLGPADELIGPRLQTESKRLAKLMTGRVLAKLGALSRTQLQSYYESHPPLYAIPAQRDLRIVRVASAGAAERIKHEIAAGKTFASAARGLPRQPQMSVRGFAPRYEWGDFREPVLNEAIFAAKLHTLEGPLRVSALYGYFVFEVVHDYPSHQRPFAQVQRKVLSQLPGKLRQEQLASFSKGWTSTWRAQTTCAPGFVVELCRGAPSTPSQLSSQADSIFG